MDQRSVQTNRSASDPAHRPLDIAEFQLQGQPSADLNRMLGTTHMLEAAKHLTVMHEVIAEAEKQVMSYMQQHGGETMPDHLTIYRLVEISGPIKRHPVQLATVLADTLILAADQLDTFDKSVRHKAILGIAEGLLTQTTREYTREAAAERLITGLLALMDRRGVTPRNPWHRVSLYARRLVLRDIASHK